MPSYGIFLCFCLSFQNIVRNFTLICLNFCYFHHLILSWKLIEESTVSALISMSPCHFSLFFCLFSDFFLTPQLNQLIFIKQNFSFAKESSRENHQISRANFFNSTILFWFCNFFNLSFSSQKLGVSVYAIT